MTDDNGAPLNELVRTQDFDTPHPIELDISNSVGPIEIELTDTALTHVEVRHDPEFGPLDWRSGLTGLLSWVSEQFGESGTKTTAGGLGEQSKGRGPREPIAEAVRQTRIDLTGNRLAVHTPSTGPLRTVPLSIIVRAPEDSHIGVRTGTGGVESSGPAHRVQIQSGSGSVSVDRARGSAAIRTGSGALRVGTIEAGVQARSGSGDVEVAVVDAPSSVVTGSGNAWLGAVSADVLVRSGSGAVTIADAADGQTELISGSGALRVSVRQGVAAEVDLTSSTGTAASDLPVADKPPAAEPTLRIFGRTGSGDAVLATAV